MTIFIDMMNNIRDFMDTGGQVLTVIAGVICFMWLLIFERFAFVIFSYRRQKKQLQTTWHARTEQHSWNAVNSVVSRVMPAFGFARHCNGND